MRGARVAARGAPVRVLVSEAVWDRFGSLLAAVEPVTWLKLGADGKVRGPDGAVLDGDQVRAEVAWLSNELFYGGPLAEFLQQIRDGALRWLQSGASGTDASFFGELAANGACITVTHATATPIAEYVVGEVLRHYQQPERWAEERRHRRWSHHDFREIHGTTWVVVGLGSIGSAVATRVRAFGATVVGVRRHPDGGEPVDRIEPPGRLPILVPAADILVLAAPATPATAHLVDAELLSRMREGSILVNVARGSLLDEEALRVALDRGRPEHAILDVTAVEPPPPDSWLWSHPSVMLTPHNAGGGTGRFGRAAAVFADNLRRWVEGDTLVHEVRSDDG